MMRSLIFLNVAVDSLPPGEPRGPPLLETLHALSKILAREHGGHIVASVSSRGRFAVDDRHSGRAQRGSHAQRSLGGNALRNADGPRELLARLDNLLHQAHPQSLFGTELVTRQQVSHRVSPTGLADQPERRTAQRVEAASHFELRETRICGRDPYVRSQQHLDSDRKRDPVNSHYQRLRKMVPQTERIDLALSERERIAVTREQRRKLRQVDAARKMVAVGEDYAA